MFKEYFALKALNRETPGKSWFRIEAKAGDESSVYIYDEIGYYGITADAFIRELNNITAKKINLHLNTPGGSVFDGVAIYNAAINHPATVHTHIDGLAASMGSIIALAGEKVFMASNAMFMMHNPWSIVIGDAATMRKEADLLDKISSSSLIKTYTDKSGKDEKEIKGLMDAETWMSAEDAKAAGFVDEITGKNEAAAKVSFDLSCFTKVPVALKEKPAEEPKEIIVTQNVRRKRLELVELN